MLIDITPHGDGRIAARTPFNRDFIDLLKSRLDPRPKWDPQSRVWHVSDDQRADLEAVIHEIFGASALETPVRTLVQVTASWFGAGQTTLGGVPVLTVWTRYKPGQLVLEDEVEIVTGGFEPYNGGFSPKPGTVLSMLLPPGFATEGDDADLFEILGLDEAYEERQAAGQKEEREAALEKVLDRDKMAYRLLRPVAETAEFMEVRSFFRDAERSRTNDREEQYAGRRVRDYRINTPGNAVRWLEFREEETVVPLPGALGEAWATIRAIRDRAGPNAEPVERPALPEEFTISAHERIAMLNTIKTNQART